jgi:Arc/MetJ-type ribon-helix-helix transcriptional regulator
MMGGMKVKTSVSLSQELLDAIDRRCGSPGRRSAFIERAAWEVLRAEDRERLNARDREIYEKYGEQMGAEALETIELYGMDLNSFGDEFGDEDFVDPPR